MSPTMATEASPPSDTVASLLSPFLRIPVPAIEKRYTETQYYYRSPIPYWVWITVACVGLVCTAVSVFLLIRIISRRRRMMQPPVPLVVPSQYAPAGGYPPQPQYYQPETKPNPDQHLSGYYAPAGHVTRPAPAAHVGQDVRGFYEPSPTQGVGGQGATVK